jgi:transcriptional regulator with XRE-family HTH domain
MIDFTQIAIEQISDELIKARRDKSLTQTDVANIVGGNKSNISLFESKPNVASLGKVLEHVKAIGAKLYFDSEPVVDRIGLLDEIECLISAYKSNEIDEATTLRKIKKLFR